MAQQIKKKNTETKDITSLVKAIFSPEWDDPLQVNALLSLFAAHFETRLLKDENDKDVDRNYSLNEIKDQLKDSCFTMSEVYNSMGVMLSVPEKSKTEKKRKRRKK